uniref:Uncharacterized protein n=1 Tax=Brassica oleracea var. oleracea TaxID=109376 RepID=A0A0D2ZQP9_BRAOL
MNRSKVDKCSEEPRLRCPPSRVRDPATADLTWFPFGRQDPPVPVGRGGIVGLSSTNQKPSCSPTIRFIYSDYTQQSILAIHLQAILYIDFRKKTATKACPEISQGLSSFPVQHEEISWRKKFGSYLFGMSDVVAKQSAEANTPLNIKNLHLGSKSEHWGSFSHSVSCGMPLGRTVVGLYKQFKNIDAFPVNDRSTPTTVTPTTVTISYDNKRRTELFLKDRIPSWIAVTGYVIMAIVSIVTVPHLDN